MANIVDQASESYRLTIETKYNEILATKFGGNEILAELIVSSLISIGLYWILGLIYFVVDYTKKPAFFYQFKIQRNNDQLKKDKVGKLLNQIVFNQIFHVILAYGLLLIKYKYFPIQRKVPTLTWFLFEFVMFNLIREVTFYYSHRALHHSSVYKYIHKRHHEWQSPIALAAVYSHPIEHVLSNIFPIILGPILMHSHNLSGYIWMAYSIWETLIAHCGYHFPGSPISPVFHDYHHLKFTCNFGVYGLLDKLHGTDKLYRNSPFYKLPRIYFSLKPSTDMIYNSDKME
ncbi:hypothetical protein RDWZM_002839 [Blomia tropicalis]|uniref:Fatty acid hydroxylase domain-containing protein n=1 Tax=Blomia tropicalis TaxID=40697 RepID=A0A9Q0MEG2_BLOTA|nr:hypothetical protein RDWZM_002839 [Blomia tropicalis]